MTAVAHPVIVTCQIVKAHHKRLKQDVAIIKWELVPRLDALSIAEALKVHLKGPQDSVLM